MLLICVGAQAQTYTPTEANKKAREAFSNDRFGIFIHWGLYSMFAQGEWYMQDASITLKEYSKVARGFYPAYFNAHDWVKAIKDSRAGYICLTSRHQKGVGEWMRKYGETIRGTKAGDIPVKEWGNYAKREPAFCPYP